MNPNDFKYHCSWQQLYTTWQPVDIVEMKIETMETLEQFPDAKQVIDRIKSKL